MKKLYLIYNLAIIALISTNNSWAQTTIAQWNFNGTSSTTIPGGETSPTPALGTSSSQLVGGTTATFASGNSTTGTLETETTSPPNFGWNSTGYAPAGTDSKLRGVQFNVSTIGQAGIIFKFEQRLSNTSSNTYVVQYTANRTATTPVWVDAQTFTFIPATTGTGDIWYNSRVVDVSTKTELDNNLNVAFRVVSAFDPNAGNYVAATAGKTYAGGTVRYDMVTITSKTTLGITSFETNAKEFIISPNPCYKEIVHFNENQDIKVFNTIGELILEAQNTSSLDTKSFSEGVYFIKTANGITKKLIVR